MEEATALAAVSREGTMLVELRHAVPGRARFHVRGLARSPSLAARLVRRFPAQRPTGILTLSTTTGNLVLRFPEARRATELARELDAAVREEISRAAAVPDTGRTPWHALSREDALDRVDSDEEGLTSEDARTRRARHGANALAAPKPASVLAQAASQFANTPSLLLGASAVASLLTHGFADAALLGVVLGGNAGIGLFTERGVDRVLRSLGLPEAEKAIVRRDARAIDLTASELVPGDVIELGAGPVAADVRLLAAERLYADESALTGESLPVAKAVAAVPDTARLAERTSMLYRGTVVVGGSGRGVVVATGGETEVGAIQALMGEARTPRTPLQKQLDGLGRELTALACAACGAVVLAGLARGNRWGTLFRSTLALAIAAVPEGLPAVGTATLALGVRRLRERDILVRRLGAIEALGSLTDVCLDKTGTITENRMSVREAVTLRAKTRGETQRRPRGFDDLATVAAYCNDASPRADGTWQGTPTEVALARFAKRIRGTTVRPARLATRYRSRDAAFMSTLHRLDDGSYLLAVKGSPDEVLARCTLDASGRAAVVRENGRLAQGGLRVLGFAWRQGATEKDTAREEGWTWLGLVGLADPPRAGARELVQAFKAAGIRTRILTGDQETTAFAIGRELGLNGDDGPSNGKAVSVADLDDDALERAVDARNVFARVSPEDKLRIVRALQRSGRVTAVAGDGVNDGPALRAADVGIAMGAGAGVAREAAHVLLAQNDLETLYDAVRHGRAVRANVEKALRFLVTTNASEILLGLASAVFRKESLLSARQLLWLNLLTDVLPALALGLEAPDEGIMRQPPRDPREPLLDKGAWRVLLLDATALAGAAAIAAGLHRREASTAAFLTLTIAQTLHTLSARSRDATKITGNGWVTASMIGSLLSLVGATHLPLLRRLLGHDRASLGAWMTALGAGAGSWIAVETAKTLRAGRRELGR